MGGLASSQGIFASRSPVVVTHQLKEVRRRTNFAWSDIHLAPFEVHGFIALRAPDRSPHFNLPDQVRERRLRMNWHKSYSQPVECLSLTVLLVFSSLNRPMSAIELYRPARGRGISIVQAFGHDCLCSMPREGGCIPLDSLEIWWNEYVRS